MLIKIWVIDAKKWKTVYLRQLRFVDLLETDEQRNHTNSSVWDATLDT